MRFFRDEDRDAVRLSLPIGGRHRLLQASVSIDRLARLLDNPPHEDLDGIELFST